MDDQFDSLAAAVLHERALCVRSILPKEFSLAHGKYFHFLRLIAPLRKQVRAAFADGPNLAPNAITAR
jgi:hypothetical protein